MQILDLLLGKRLPSSASDEVKIGIAAGVPAMGLDALSSAAYGPEAALTVLACLGAAGLSAIGPITIVILVLLAMLYFSYRQTIAAYPSNGGSYTVAKENLGTWPGLLAAAALAIDYVLNVAVGISAGVAALVSAMPHLHRYTLPICLVILVFITLMNLRGTGEAGLVFSVPMYVFIGSLLILLGTGVARSIGGHPHPVVAPPPLPKAAASISLWLLLRAFASGCTAMTGVEAISNGVSAFKEPKVKNAHVTLTIIVITLAVLLGGVAFLTRAYHLGAMDQDKAGYQSVLSQLTAAVFGRGTFYYVTICSVLACLCLSANTSFVDFPRLCRLVSQDGFLPVWFSIVGRRLVYSVGILFLAVAAAALLIVFRGITDKLIPLYAVGAFLAFTLSQSGMVVHWHKRRSQGPAAARASGPWLEGDSSQETQAPTVDATTHGPEARVTGESTRDTTNEGGRQFRLAVNATGATATAVALTIILIAKFIDGAWITVLAIPLLLGTFWFVHKHYVRLAEQTKAHGKLQLTNKQPPVALVLTKGWDRPTGKAIRFALWLSDDIIALHLSNLSGEENREAQQKVLDDWRMNVEEPAKEQGAPVPRIVPVACPLRYFVKPILGEIDKVKQQYPGRMIAVVIPKIMELHWWNMLLHKRLTVRLRVALINRDDHEVVVIEVPWFIEDKSTR